MSSQTQVSNTENGERDINTPLDRIHPGVLLLDQGLYKYHHLNKER